MAKFELFESDYSVIAAAADRRHAPAVRRRTARPISPAFAIGLGLWFVVMFAIGWLILAA